MIAAYKIILSNKTEIPIDEDELEFAIRAIEQKSIGKMRKGIFNPAFLVAIVEDEDRLKRLAEATETAKKHNSLFPDKPRMIPEGFKPLRDIFSKQKKLN